jgi:hypothetical protein
MTAKCMNYPWLLKLQINADTMGKTWAYIIHGWANFSNIDIKMMGNNS